MILGWLMICCIGIKVSLVVNGLSLLLVSCIAAADELRHAKPKGVVGTWIAEIESCL